jgi:hypothetical protein
VPDGKKPDGRPGPGQRSFGMSLLEYKAEWARAEGWKDAGEDGLGVRTTGEERKPVMEWDAGNGAELVVARRIIDSRFAGAAKLNRTEEPVTLIEEFDEIGVSFDPAPGDDLWDGVHLINSLLSYDTEKPLGFLNRPKLFVCEDCVNVIFAMQTWTGNDGTKGATKDPIDVVRYAVLAGCEYESGEAAGRDGEGAY